MGEIPYPPVRGDMIEAIGEPYERRAWPDEATTGFEAKIAARAAIDAGEIKTLEDATNRFRARVTALKARRGQICDAALTVWIRVETQFFASARKYLRELQEAKDCNK